MTDGRVRYDGRQITDGRVWYDGRQMTDGRSMDGCFSTGCIALYRCCMAVWYHIHVEVKTDWLPLVPRTTKYCSKATVIFEYGTHEWLLTCTLEEPASHIYVGVGDAIMAGGAAVDVVLVWLGGVACAGVAVSAATAVTASVVGEGMAVLLVGIVDAVVGGWVSSVVPVMLIAT